jgi:hypothetical protein
MSAVPVMTPVAPAVSAQDLELEHAELLPARETLWIPRLYPRYNPGGSPDPLPSGSPPPRRSVRRLTLAGELRRKPGVAAARSSRPAVLPGLGGSCLVSCYADAWPPGLRQ